jgi:hypothetical protein
MKHGSKFIGLLGCLTCVVGPLLGIVLYPRAPWLFAFVLVGVAILIVRTRFSKGPLPAEVADHAERLLEGRDVAWDVDDYEHLNPREPELRELWRRTIQIGGLPEEWPRLDDVRKNELRDIICAVRLLATQTQVKSG